MRRVKILDETLANQIAAGEVVERPSSVVKELVENALDARARQISVTLSNGGTTAIEVLDDGVGMSRDDALLAIQRFGTSKIENVEELQNISSLGFRGEALPSIASVSHFSLQTRSTADTSSETGVEIRLTGGEQAEVIERDLPQGTRVRVQKLFFNTPARKRFLRTERTEASAIKGLLTDFSLAYPECRFILRSDGKEILNFSPVASSTQRIQQLQLAGESPLSISQSIETEHGSYILEGLLSQPIEAAQNASKLHFIVNGRIVRDKLLLRAIKDAYGIYLKGGQYPKGALIVSVPYAELDVNVHPQKAEVRFAHPEHLFRLVSRGIRAALSSKASVRPDRQPQESFSAPDRRTEVVWEVAEPAPAANPPPQHLSILPERTRKRFVGQIFSCYLIFEDGERLAFVDMHAAHERVRFFELKSAYLNLRQPSVQQLLVPEVLDDTPDVSLLRKLGFDIEIFGDGSVVVRGVPAFLTGVSPKRLFGEQSDIRHFEDGLRDNTAALEQSVDSVIARLACHSSIRSGRELEPEEAYKLLDALEEAESSGYCPHGRPIIRYFNKAEVEAFFGRE